MSEDELKAIEATPYYSEKAREDARALVAEARRLRALDADGPGTPIARLTYMLDEMERRFPGVVNPVASDPPEPKLLAAVDAALAKLAEVTRERDDWQRECDARGRDMTNALAESQAREAELRAAAAKARHPAYPDVRDLDAALARPADRSALDAVLAETVRENDEWWRSLLAMPVDHVISDEDTRVIAARDAKVAEEAREKALEEAAVCVERLDGGRDACMDGFSAGGIADAVRALAKATP